jgi:hypothetical protein
MLPVFLKKYITIRSDGRSKVQQIKKAAHVKEHAFENLWAPVLNKTRLKSKKLSANGYERILVSVGLHNFYALA